ncbi:MAG: aldo/keto reductase, partial [bacterium]
NLKYSDVIESTKESLRQLNLEYVDLLYVHWPAKDYDAPETLGAFQELRDEGLIRRIGVSNFTPRSSVGGTGLPR